MPDRIFKQIALNLRPLNDPEIGYVASDFDLNPDAPRVQKPPKPAAVLVPIIERNGKNHVIFTCRSFDLSNHAGQVSFPGGRVDESDENLVQTALREAYEEIGLAPQFVTPIGFGDNYLSGTNYLITPVIAKIEQGVEFKINNLEVDEIFEIPFERIFAPNCFEVREYYLQKIARKFYAMNFEKHLLWGVTAGLIVNLAKRMGFDENLP